MPTQTEFVHLHVHSQYSLLDGVCHFGPLFKRVRELGMDAVALTDHGNLFGAYAFYKEAAEHDVRPIIGCEVYLSPTDRFDRTSVDARNHRLHMVLLTENYTGYQNLCRLVSTGYLEGFYHRPRIDRALLAEYSEGLIGLSGCLSGVISQFLRDDRRKDAEAWADEMSQIMGPGNFYVELMDHGLPEQKTVNQQLLEVARRLELPVVATNDAHYLRRSDAKTQDLLMAIGTGKTLDEEDRLSFDVDEFFLKSPAEMEKAFGHIDGALSNTVEIARRCHSDMGERQRLLPEFRPPDGRDPAAYLQELVLDGLGERYDDVTPELEERAGFELGVIRDMGFVDYFLVVWDFIRFAREQSIPVGPGRGSGAGSLVAYSLRITDLDPIENKLFFERFLNPERVSMPDFDIDFCPLRREEVVNYVRDKYGHENVANIITFGKMMARAAVRDVGRVMKLPLNIVDRVARLIPSGPKVTIKKAFEESPELKELYESDPQIKELLSRAERIEGSVRQPGMHAAGVVVSRKPLIETIPLYRVTGRDEVITQFNMTEVEEIGLLKIDFLGLKNLTVIEDCIALVHQNHGVAVDWDEIGMDDAKTYELFQRGDGFGVFQVESSGMREMLRRALPTCFEDITALIALYRPGPMQFIDSFINRKHGREEITYLHPDMEESLKETYGLIVYQEQVMQVASRLAGFTLGQADILRRAMGKKKADEMQRMRQLFEEGCAKNSISAQLATQIFDMIMQFAQYGFNKAHAAAYAVISYRTAYLKANYPAEYMAALLTNEIRGGASDKLGLYIGVARDMGLRVLQPDINLSQVFFSVDAGDIRFGLAAIKNVGQGAVEHIIERREADGPFESFQNFCERVDTHVVNSRAIECLIQAGAFDSTAATRPQLLAIMGDALEMGASKREMRESGQTSLFDFMEPQEGEAGLDAIPLPNIPDWTDREKFDKEKELAGIFLSGHPLDRFRADIKSFARNSSGDLVTLANNDPVTTVGIVTQVREIATRKGEPMAFVELEDFEGRFEVVVFPRVFDEARHILITDAVVFVQGRYSLRPDDEEGKVLADAVQPIEDLRRSRTKFIEIACPMDRLDNRGLESIRSLLRTHHGQSPVRFRLSGPEGEEVLVEPAARFRVNPSDEFLKAFSGLQIGASLRFHG